MSGYGGGSSSYWFLLWWVEVPVSDMVAESLGWDRMQAYPSWAYVHDYGRDYISFRVVAFLDMVPLEEIPMWLVRGVDMLARIYDDNKGSLGRSWEDMVHVADMDKHDCWAATALVESYLQGRMELGI